MLPLTEDLSRETSVEALTERTPSTLALLLGYEMALTRQLKEGIAESRKNEKEALKDCEAEAKRVRRLTEQLYALQKSTRPRNPFLTWEQRTKRGASKLKVDAYYGMVEGVMKAVITKEAKDSKNTLWRLQLLGNNPTPDARLAVFCEKLSDAKDVAENYFA